MEYTPVIIIALFIGWLVAEFRAGRVARISLGILSIVGAVVVTHVVARIIPGYEQQLHRASLRELGELAAKGDLQRVQQALSTYNDTAGTNGSTYTAAMKMWMAVSAKPKKHEDQSPGLAAP
jgi:hypothetical protein